MTRIKITMIAAALVLSACGGGAAGPTAPRFLSYGVEPGTTLAYASEMDMRFTMTADLGDLGGGAELGLGDTSMEMAMTGSVVYTYGAGPTADTYSIEVVQVPGSIERVMMEFMGERLEFEDTAAINAMVPEIPPVEYRLVIDELGNLVSAEAGGTTIALDSLGLAGSNGFSSGGSASQLLGPAFSPEAVAPGDEWSWERWDAMPGTDDVLTTGHFRYVRDEKVDDRDTVVIEYRTETGGFRLDAATLAELSVSDEELGVSTEELAAMATSGFAIAVDGITVDGTVFFDPIDGVVVRQDSTTTMSMGIETPELMGAAVVQRIEVDFAMRLIG